MGVREHEQPSRALALVRLCPRVPLPVGRCAALLREAGREQQLPGTAEAEQAMPAHLSKVLGVSEHREDKVHRCWIASPGQGWAEQACGTW